MAGSIFGGTRRLTDVTALLVPVMAIIYLGVGLVVVALNYQNIPAMFSAIFSGAFDFPAIFGGFAGSAMMYGIKRGLYSNEAGVGSAPNAAASASVSRMSRSPGRKTRMSPSPSALSSSTAWQIAVSTSMSSPMP